MILPFLISAPYISIIGYAAAGWLRPTIPSTTLQSLSTATLLICCKNEEQQLPSLFQSIEQQLLLPQQILFVNDHSTDNTENLLNAFCNKHSYCSYINAEKNGKKEAILQALPLIKTDYILFTDADCTFHPAWIQTMMTYCTNHKTDILLGSVKINTNHTLFSKLQALEFASLVAANAGATLNGTPLYGNGANMAVKREIYLKHQTELNTHIASGDDVFLIHTVKRAKGNISFIKDNNTLVSTSPKRNLKELMAQRQRWGGKTKHYTDALTLITAIIVALFNLSLVVSTLLFPFIPGLFTALAIMFLLKIAIDATLLIPFLTETKQRLLLSYFLPLSLLYPFYLTYAALKSIFCTSTWIK